MESATGRVPWDAITPKTAIGASRSLRRVPGTGLLSEPQPAFSLGDANRASCPTPAICRTLTRAFTSSEIETSGGILYAILPLRQRLPEEGEGCA
jgi:hypothetical protein